MRRMPWERLLLVALLLGSCEHTVNETYKIAVAGRSSALLALDQITALKSRVDALERR